MRPNFVAFSSLTQSSRAPAAGRLPSVLVSLTAVAAFALLAATVGCGGGAAPDPVAPDTTLSSSPSQVLSATAVGEFVFACSGAEPCTFECRLDTEPFAACTSPHQRSAFSDGAHSFEVRALRDDLADASPARAEFTVDAVAPMSRPTGPAGTVGAGELSYTLQCNEADCTFECALDGGAWVACASPWTVDAPRGTHTLHVRATDAAGNVELSPGNLPLDVGPGWRDVAASSSNVCAVSDEGALYCWGRDYHGTLGQGVVDAPPASAPVRVGVATDWVRVLTAPYAAHMCALNSAGSLYCWGDLEPLGGADNVSSPVVQAPSREVAAAVAGGAHLCALDSMGRLECVGDNGDGRAGLGALTDTSTFMDVGSERYVALSAGTEHSCAIREDGRLSCWGAGAATGLDASDPVTTPTTVGSDADWTVVRASVSHTCGLRAGELHCWGQVYGLADDASVTAPTPTRVGDSASWEDVWTGSSQTCARAAGGAVYCTGPSGTAFGAGFDAPRYRLVEVPELEGAKHIAFGNVSCVLDAGNQLGCWGGLSEGSHGFLLGNGDNYRRDHASYVDGDWRSLEASTGGYHACGVKLDGSLWCWGFNTRGQLGTDDLEARVSPARVGLRDDWASVSAGRSRTCGIAAGALYCWGDNNSGRLGLPAVETTYPSVTLLDDTRAWTHVSVGTDSVCGVANGELYCWGANYGAQLGVGDTATRTTPTQVGTGADWYSVTSHGTRTCGLRSPGDGQSELWCWGYLGPNDLATTPVRVGSATNWSQVATGIDGDCALGRDGVLSCIGRASGSDPTPTFSSASNATDWSFVAHAGYSGACGVRAGGGLFCWGTNELLLGPGNTSVTSQAPVARGATFTASSITLGGNAFCALDTTGGRHCWGTGAALGMGLEWRTPQAVLGPTL